MYLLCVCPVLLFLIAFISIAIVLFLPLPSTHTSQVVWWNSYGSFKNKMKYKSFMLNLKLHSAFSQVMHYIYERMHCVIILYMST